MASKKRTRAPSARKPHTGKPKKKSARKAAAKRPVVRAKAQRKKTARLRKITPDVFQDIVEPATTLYDLWCETDDTRLDSNLDLIACTKAAHDHRVATGHTATCIPMQLPDSDTP